MKINAIVYADTGPTGNNLIKPSISITAGNGRCVQVPCNSEGLIKQIAIMQTSGTAVAGTLDVYMSALPYPVGVFAIATASAVANDAIYKVFPQMAITSGAALNLTPDYDVGWPYKNIDGDNTNNQRFLYFVIKPTGAATTTKWDMMLLTESHVY